MSMYITAFSFAVCRSNGLRRSSSSSFFERWRMAAAAAAGPAAESKNKSFPLFSIHRRETKKKKRKKPTRSLRPRTFSASGAPSQADCFSLCHLTIFSYTKMSFILVLCASQAICGNTISPIKLVWWRIAEKNWFHVRHFNFPAESVEIITDSRQQRIPFLIDSNRIDGKTVDYYILYSFFRGCV